jgi:RND family efflux transporter MFP subunit
VSTDFVVGGFFNQGDILLTLDPIDYQVALEQARANVLTAQAIYSREQAMAQQAGREWDLTGKSRSEAPILALRTPYLKEAEAGLLFAKAQLKRALRKLEQTIIRAPYTGLVREKFVDVGQYAGVGSAIAKTFAIDYAEVRLPLANSDLQFLKLPSATNSRRSAGEALAKIRPNNHLEVELSSTIGGTEYRWQASIVRTEGVIDSNTRMHYAIAEIADPYGLQHEGTTAALTVGSFVNARIQGLSYDNIFAIPHSVIRGDNQVLVMDETQQLEIRRINIIRSDQTLNWVGSGLVDGDNIITTALNIPIVGMPLALFPDDL